MSNKSAFIKISDGFVEGIDINKRMYGLKHFFLSGAKLTSSKIQILQNINFSCKAGDRIAFIGNNGSGKSSLLKTIAEIYPLQTGKIVRQGSLGVIIETMAGFEYEMTGRQNIKNLMLYNNMLHKYSKDLEKKIIEFSELDDKIDRSIKTYSSGMAARLAFSVAMFQDPDILLLDEIFTVGDKGFVEKSLSMMRSKIDNSAIVILVSHSEHLIKAHCNRAILLQNGMIIADGSIDDLLQIYNF
jgi:lipopolysaccharide transport system ATP-binding protein